MTHPVQARDSLYRDGFQNVYILTDGLNGFIEKCLTPVSLRDEILPSGTSDKIKAWRAFFLGSVSSQEKSDTSVEIISGGSLIDANTLEKQLESKNTKVIDLRSQPQYSTSHIKNSISLNIENLRTNIDGVGSMLQPVDMLTRQFSLIGIKPEDNVVIVYNSKTQDATLVAIALERIGHTSYEILTGGFAAWESAKKSVVTDLPEIVVSNYPNAGADKFTLDYKTVLQYVKSKKAIILDVRPSDYFNGTKSDEARAGHIPGAINRPFSEDIIVTNEVAQFKPIEELAKAYEQIIPSKNSTVIVHCRTGHQASQTFFVLRRLLGYKNVLWYDAGWTQWAAIKELPIE